MDTYQQTAELYNRAAEAYQDKFMELDLYNDTYDAFCQLIPKPNAAVFEVGCGPGNITRYLLAKRPDFKITGIDFAPNMVKLAKANNPAANFSVMDCREIDKITERFDGVMCGFTMPYLTKEDCEKLVKDCSNLLNEGGIFYFSLAEDDYSKSGYRTSSGGQQYFFCYHRAGYLEQFLQHNHFETVAAFRINYPLANEDSETHLIYIARKN